MPGTIYTADGQVAPEVAPAPPGEEVRLTPEQAREEYQKAVQEHRKFISGMNQMETVSALSLDKVVQRHQAGAKLDRGDIGKALTSIRSSLLAGTALRTAGIEALHGRLIRLQQAIQTISLELLSVYKTLERKGLLSEGEVRETFERTIKGPEGAGNENSDTNSKEDNAQPMEAPLDTSQDPGRD